MYLRLHMWLRKSRPKLHPIHVSEQRFISTECSLMWIQCLSCLLQNFNLLTILFATLPPIIGGFNILSQFLFALTNAFLSFDNLHWRETNVEAEDEKNHRHSHYHKTGISEINNIAKIQYKYLQEALKKTPANIKAGNEILRLSF